MDNMPPLPEKTCLARDTYTGESAFGYEDNDMHAYARAYAEQRCAPLAEQAAMWHALYRRAINEANGLTNYVEDRPELRSSERRLTAIEADARAARAALAAQEKQHG